MADNRYQGGGRRGRGRSNSIFDEAPARARDEGEGDDHRGFLDRAGEQFRSWFGDEDRPGQRDEHAPRHDRPERRPVNPSGAELGGGGVWGTGRFDPRNRHGDYADSYGRSYGGSSGGSGWDDERNQDWRGGEPGRGRSHYGSEHGYGGFQGDYRGGDEQRGFGGRGDYAGGRRSFGSQAYRGSSQDDHYRSWRDRQLAELDRDYEDFCRERQQQFHSDFDSWRRDRRQAEGRQGEEPRAANAGGTAGGARPEPETSGDVNAETARAGAGRGRTGGRSKR